MNRIPVNTLVGAAAALALASSTSPAAAQATYHACRVPTVGVIYMIDDAAAECLEPTHVKFSWAEGGEVADGSVTSAKILDGTIVAADTDPTSVQARITSSCAANRAIRAVGSDGAVTCQPIPPTAGVAYLAAGVNIDPTLTTLTAASIEVDHPGPGFLIASGTGAMFCTVDQSIAIALSTSPGASSDGYAWAVPGNIWTRVVKNTVIPVAAAGTSTLYFNVSLGLADNCAVFRALDLYAIYVPNEY